MLANSSSSRGNATIALALVVFLFVGYISSCHGLATPSANNNNKSKATTSSSSRREILQGLMFKSGATLVAAATAATSSSIIPFQTSSAWAVDVDDFLKSGMVPNPMGVGGQAGKSKPETGVLLREGSEVRRDARSGDVLAEILVKDSSSTSSSSSTSNSLMPVVASFSSQWPLATGTNYDVECRNPQGDGAFLAVTPPIDPGKTVSDLKDSFFVQTLFSETGRFSFYGTPTDIKVKKSTMTADGRSKIMDVTFSTLSQATQTEIPRFSRIVATIPNGSQQAVMLVGSASATRWKNGADKAVASTIDSFQAVAAPQGGLKLRVKEKRS